MREIVAAVLMAPALALAAQAQWLSPDSRFYCHGGHPRCQSEPSQYRYPQFHGESGIGGFAGFSDVLANGPHLTQYQTFLSELESYRPNTNAVALWSDAAARVDGARVWGAFISARSGLLPGNDAQLIGLEVDVLNDGKDGISPAQSKVGVQIVGFGKKNTNALEIMSQSPSSGRFMNGVTIASGAIDRDGTVIGVGSQKARVGLNLEHSAFADSAVLLSPDSPITFRQAGLADAKIYRDKFGKGSLVLRAAPDGIRLTTSHDSANILAIDDEGRISRSSLVVRHYAPLGILGLVTLAVVLILSVTLNIFTLRELGKLRRIIELEGPTCK